MFDLSMSRRVQARWFLHSLPRPGNFRAWCLRRLFCCL